jgi:hypothetical protein
MGKDMVSVLNRQLKSYKPKRQPVKPHFGFVNVKLGLFSCTRNGGVHYRLTQEGVRRAVASG